MRKYFKSPLSSPEGEDRKVDLLNPNSADLGYAYRYAKAYTNAGLKYDKVEDGKTEVEAVMEAEKATFKTQRDKLLDEEMLERYFENR